MYTYKEFGPECLQSVKNIYQQEGWNSYLHNDASLKRAFEKSLLRLGAFDNDQLVGFVRCVGDGEHVVIVQDLIVSPPYQKQGIGTKLFQMVWDQYLHVRMFHVITDLEDEIDNHFYQSFGMKPLVEGHMISYFR